MNFQNKANLIGEALTYSEYRREINRIMQHNSKPDSYGKYANYTKDHIAAMDRLDKTVTVSPLLKEALKHAPPTTWLVLTEGWCGDAAFSTPLLAKMEDIVPDNIKMRFLLRDEHMDIMENYLTDGGRSIPKVIVLSEDLRELATWGPRPEGLHALMHLWKSEGLGIRELVPKVQEWYDIDETKALQDELLAVVQSYTGISIASAGI